MKGGLAIVLWLLAMLGLSGPAAAQSWIESDFYCRVYGCVVVHDGYSFDVYDNYNFATGSVVAPNERMIAWAGNPFQGTGTVNPVFTGTRTEAFHLAPLEEEGVLIGIDQTGNGEIDLSPGVNQRGFLDASGVFQPVSLSNVSRVVAEAQSSQRSFYLTSRTGFYLAAQARIVGQPSSMNSIERLGNVGFIYDITDRGNDDGMDFGRRARNANNARRLGQIDDLGDIVGAPTYLLEFRNEIRQNSQGDLPDQSVRFDYAYGFDDYDLSMGAGHLRYQIEFSFYNR